MSFQVVGAGASGGAMDAGNLLKPMLGRGELRCIGEWSWFVFGANELSTFSGGCVGWLESSAVRGRIGLVHHGQGLEQAAGVHWAI
jgi:hypothetical protein